MFIRHSAAGADDKGTELPNDAYAAVMKLFEDSGKTWEKTQHLIILGIREEQGRVAEAGRRKLKAAFKKDKKEPPTQNALDAAAAAALLEYSCGCTHRPKLSPLEDAIKKELKKGGNPTTVIQKVVSGLPADEQALVKAGFRTPGA